MYTLVTRSKDILDTSFTINDTGVNATNGVDTKFDTLASLQFSVTNAIYSIIRYYISETPLFCEGGDATFYDDGT